MSEQAIAAPKKEDLSCCDTAASVSPASSSISSSLYSSSSSSVSSFLTDFIKVSRPGWWIVTVWLYVAPTAATTLSQNQQSWDMTSIMICWFGLAYCCLPLNALVYGLNDYADVQLDANNQRKGNLMFGPKLTRSRLQQLVKMALTSTFVLLFVLLWAATKEQHHQRQQQDESSSSSSSSWSSVLRSLCMFVLWYILVLIVNVAYNFNVLGHLSEHGPFEIPVVYFGFSLITVLSYWLNVAVTAATTASSDEAQQHDNNVFGYYSNSSTSTSTTTSANTNTTTTQWFLLFGCNGRYWIHLWFLVCRTQLWTEYMDYETDRSHYRKTTLARFFPTKSKARMLVLVVLLLEAIWNWQQTLVVGSDWNALFYFSLLGVISFVGMELVMGATTTNTKTSSSSTTSPSSSSGGVKPTSSTSSTFVWVALVQSMGGLWLIQDCWKKQVFVCP